MLFGVGCDLCEIARMEQSLFGPHGEAFEARVFGEAERQALALDSCRENPQKGQERPRRHSAAERPERQPPSPQSRQRGRGLRREGSLPQGGGHWAAGTLCPAGHRGRPAGKRGPGLPVLRPRRRMGGRARPPRSPLPQPRGRHGAGLLHAGRGKLTTLCAYNGISPPHCISRTPPAHTESRQDAPDASHSGAHPPDKQEGDSMEVHRGEDFLRRSFASGGLGAGRCAPGADRTERDRQPAQTPL